MNGRGGRGERNRRELKEERGKKWGGGRNGRGGERRGVVKGGRGEKSLADIIQNYFKWLNIQINITFHN